MAVIRCRVNINGAGSIQTGLNSCPMPAEWANRTGSPTRGRYLAAIWPELLTLTRWVLPPLTHWPYQPPSAPMVSVDRLLQP